MLVTEYLGLNCNPFALVICAALLATSASAELSTSVQTDEHGAYPPVYVSPHTGISYQHSYG
jgi:hypothetical protein